MGYNTYRQSAFRHSYLQVGKQNSNTAGYGFPLGIQIAGTTSTRAARIYADDAGVALPAGAYAGAESRLLLTKSMSASVSAYGSYGHIKNIATQGTQDNVAGVWAYNENSGSITVGSSSASLVYSGLCARVDVPSGATIKSGGYVSAIGVTADLGGTHTGKAGVLQVTNPAAGTWDFFAVFDSATGAIATQAGGVVTITHKLPIIAPDGSTKYIPVGTIV